MSDRVPRPAEALRLAVVVGALGVVFGDIGTSPIYTLQTVFNPDDPHPVPVSSQNVLGVVSLILWSVMLIVTLTYVILAMRVDNDGEGGIMALITLLRRWAARGSSSGRTRVVALLAGLGIFGAALFLGDSMITPAISVLSAVEGLKVVRPSLGEWVVPITAVIIVGLFAAQRFGTAAVGRLFGPVMIVWFTAIGACGVWGITAEPEILRALSPTYAVGFLVGHFHLAFFLLAPHWARVPMVLLATAATVIASQAVITGAFSVASQAAQLGYLPRLRIVHTSRSAHGQIYVPWINWLLLVSVLTLVFAFRSSAALAFAFGMAVTGTIAITTVLFSYIAFRTWRAPRWLLGLGLALLLSVDLLFFAANLTKLVHGAWLPLVIAVTAFTIMTTWQRGRQLVTARRVALEGSLRDFVDTLSDKPAGPAAGVTVVPGTAIFLNRGDGTAPLALRANVEHNHVRHEHVLVVAVQFDTVPRVPASDRIVIDHLGDDHDGITHATIRFGYAETPDVPAVLARLRPEQTEGRLDLDRATYFLSHIELRLSDEPGMATWRKRLFIASSHMTADAAEHFRLPRDRTILLGAHVEV